MKFSSEAALVRDDLNLRLKFIGVGCMRERELLNPPGAGRNNVAARPSPRIPDCFSQYGV